MYDGSQRIEIGTVIKNFKSKFRLSLEISSGHPRVYVLPPLSHLNHISNTIGRDSARQTDRQTD